MLRIYCPVCNGLLKLNEDQKEAVCQSCGRIVRVPQGYTEAESGYLFAAEALKRRDFAGAAAAYTDILAAYPEQAEAYFKRALASYEIEYEKLPDGSYRLLCHQAEKTDFLEDQDVRTALSLTEGAQREEYEKQAESVHKLQERVAFYAKAHPPVDVWLSVSGGSFVSLDRAVQIRRLLGTMNLSVFCPELDLEDEERQDWESALYRAESTAKAMIIVAAEPSAFTDAVNFDAERFLYRKQKAVRSASGQIPVLLLAFADLDEYEDIPDSYFDGIDRRLPMGAESFAADLKEAVTEAMEGYREALHEQAGRHGNFAYANLLSQARQSLEGGRFAEASARYQEILLKNPQESQAYWGLLLSGRECRDEQALIQQGSDITEDGNYRNALAFASEREQQTYRGIAADAQEMEKVYASREAERKRIEREQEEERRRREIEVDKAGKRKQDEEQRAKNRRKNRVRTFVAAVVVVAAAAGVGYFAYSKSPAGLRAKLYKEATHEYNQFRYQEAYDLFLELEGYKDSDELREICRGRLMQDRYRSAKEDLNNMETRAEAVAALITAESYVQEAAGLLDEMRAEGAQYLAEGRLYEAWNTLRSFGSSNEDFVKAWRLVFGRGILSGSLDGKVLALTADGSLEMAGSGGAYEFEEGGAISADLSDSGNVAGVVRRDGTAYLLGETSGLSVDGWKNLVCIRVSDELAAGISADGGLYVTGLGKAASNVIQADVDGSHVIAVRADGTVYCTNPAAQIPADWSGIASAVLVGDAVLAVTNDGQLLQSGCDFAFPETGVLAPYQGCGMAGVVTLDGEVRSAQLGGKNKESRSGTNYFAAFTAVSDEKVELYGDAYGVNCMVYGTDDDCITMRTSVRDMPAPDVPNPNAGESEGES